MLFISGCSRNPGFAGDRLFKSVEIIGRRGAGAGEFNKPRSVAVDRSDNVYVVDMTGRVQKFSPDGKFLLSWQMPQTDLGKPKGMCLDEKGNIVVVEPHYQRVNHFSTDGNLVFQWGKPGTNRGELTLPRSIAVDRLGQAYVTEYTRVDRVQGFSAIGREPFLLFGSPGTGSGEFNRAEGITIDPAGLLYVADSCNHRIQVFSPAGKWLRSYGQPGNNPGEMSYPYDVRVDASGYQFVCEFGNSRVQVFDGQDHSVEILGGPGAQPGQFSNPWSIALNSHGDLYVCDAGNHRVQKFIRK
jgi:DNA-binding beta-propeller fold protein YncE